MPTSDDVPQLRPADHAELLHSLSYALRHGRTANRQERDDVIARLFAEQVLGHLERSNHVAVQKPSARARAVSFPASRHLTD